MPEGIVARKKGVPQYTVLIPMHRKPAFYLKNVALPSVCIGLMSFAPMAVRIDALGMRANITMTLILTTMAFKFATANTLPKLPYFTLLDEWSFAHAHFAHVHARTHVRTTANFRTQGFDPTSRKPCCHRNWRPGASQISSCWWALGR